MNQPHTTETEVEAVAEAIYGAAVRNVSEAAMPWTELGDRRKGLYLAMAQAARGALQKTREPCCIQCWCDGHIVKATQFVVFRWLCDKHLAARSGTLGTP